MTFEEKAYKAGKYVRNVVKNINLPNSTVKTKSIIRKEPRATVVVDQPVYSSDKSRFFKEEYEKEKRRFLFR